MSALKCENLISLHYYWYVGTKGIEEEGGGQASSFCYRHTAYFFNSINETMVLMGSDRFFFVSWKKLNKFLCVNIVESCHAAFDDECV